MGLKGQTSRRNYGAHKFSVGKEDLLPVTNGGHGAGGCGGTSSVNCLLSNISCF